MSSAIVDQPPPVPTGRRPSWEIVISYVQSAAGPANILELVLTDMRERDAVGRQRYGTPLTSGNGRDHLVDAFQKQLDGAVYLATKLTSTASVPTHRSTKTSFQIPTSATVCSAYRTCSRIKLRALIEERTP